MNEYLLFFSLFFPRISLLVAYLNAAIPVNGLPFVLEFFLTLFIPRVLMIVYIGTTLGWDSGWLIAHVIFAILAWGSSSVTYNSSSSRS